MSRRILLIEPNYKNKYPPIGLMKISTYHKLQNDDVEFFKGDLNILANRIKVERCVEDLRNVDRRVNWYNHSSTIELYYRTRQIKFIDKLIKDSKSNRGEQIEEAVRKYYKYPPKDHWDRIYIATLFTFYWDITIRTIKFAKQFLNDQKSIFVGGVMASLMKDEIHAETGIMPIAGLLDKPYLLDNNTDLIIDELPLDYSILEEIEYKYPTQSAYFTYMTKGCTRKCAFCSVPKLEPTYKEKIEASEKFKIVNTRFGEQRNLLLMDNNVLASPRFPEIIQEIKDMGFTNGALFEEPNQLDIAIKNIRDGYNEKVYSKKAIELIHQLRKRLKDENLAKFDRITHKFKLYSEPPVSKSNLLNAYRSLKSLYEQNRIKTSLTRYVDFNQGTDARYITEENMRLMSEIPIKPLRIAFDHVGIKNTYINAVELAAKYGIKNLSNYILYNFHDTPADFYERLRINVELGKRLNIKIFSFPMKYIPLFGEEAKHRRYIGKNWNRKFIRAIQSILNATKGIVAPGYDFFQMAFGNSLEEFYELLWMPEAYIINRNFFTDNGMIRQWREDFIVLSEEEKKVAQEIISENNFDDLHTQILNPVVLRLLSHYAYTKNGKRVIDRNVKKLRNKFNKLIREDVFVDLTLTHDFDSTFRTRLMAS